MVRLGHRAAIVFFVQRGDAAWLRRGAGGCRPGLRPGTGLAEAGGVEILPMDGAIEAEREQDGLWSLSWNLPGLLPWVRRPYMVEP